MKDPPKLKPHKLVGSCGLNHYAEDVWSNLGFKEPKLLIISPSIPHWQPLQRSASSCFYCTYEILCGIKASSSSGLSSDLSLEKKTWFRRRWDISTGVYSSAVTPQERWIRSWSLILSATAVEKSVILLMFKNKNMRHGIIPFILSHQWLSQRNTTSVSSWNNSSRPSIYFKITDCGSHESDFCNTMGNMWDRDDDAFKHRQGQLTGDLSSFFSKFYWPEPQRQHFLLVITLSAKVEIATSR